MRHTLAAVLISVGLFSIGCDQKTPPPQPQAASPQAAEKPKLFVIAPANASSPVTLASTEASMQRRGPEIYFSKVELAEAFQLMADQTNVPLDVDWANLANLNITPESVVNANLKNVQFKKALDVILESVGKGQTKGTAVAAIESDGRVLISTRDDAFTRLATEERYPISDLMSTTDPKSLPVIQEQFRSLILDTVDPQSWATPAEPMGGTASFDKDILVITQTPGPHSEIKALLKKLRDQRPSTT